MQHHESTHLEPLVSVIGGDKPARRTERRAMMKRITAVILTILAAHAVATPGGAGTAARTVSVTCQGLIRFTQPELTRVSPRGDYSMEILPARGDFNGIEATAIVTSKEGARWRLEDLRGNAFFVSDVGRVITLQTPDSNVVPTVLTVLGLDGEILLRVEVPVLSDPALSPDGSRLVYRSAEGIEMLDLRALERTLHPSLDLFAVNAEGLLAGVALHHAVPAGGHGRPDESPRASEVLLFDRTGRIASMPLDGPRPRRLGFSPDGSSVLLLGPGELMAVDPAAGDISVLFADRPGAEFRDLAVTPDAIYIGARRIENETFAGELITLDPGGQLLARERGAVREIPRSAEMTRAADATRSARGIPWPLAPNEQHPVGNTHAEYQKYGSTAYCHPGVDVMGSPWQPVYAVREGVVKAVLTTSGEWHWRVAVGDTATPGMCGGYLYAHLDEHSIAVNVGDPVTFGQYLGDLVEWPVYDFTHIHFARIEDSGTQWYGNWLCTGNAHLDFDNQSENEPPVFEPARGNDLLAFCENQTSNYQDPSALHGEVDIIAHVGDIIECDWVCTVQEIRYTIYPVEYPQFPVVDDKLAVYFDMVLDTYQGGPIDPFLVELLYKRDSVCQTMGDYNDREFYHIITNSDGNQIYEQSDLWEAWDTALVPDADYIIRVTATDVAGNAAVDSMLVSTVNGNPTWVATDEPLLVLHQSYPNPGAAGATIAFALSSDDDVALSIYDPSGRLVRRLLEARVPAGVRTVAWDGRDARGKAVASGVYLCRLETASETKTQRLVLVR